MHMICQREHCQVHTGEEDHARRGWTTLTHGVDSTQSQSEWQRIEINGESTSMVWPAFGSRTAKNRRDVVFNMDSVMQWLLTVADLVKPIWILLKQETVSGSGISWAICKSAPRCRQITTPAPHHSVFTGRMLFLSPNQQRQSTECKCCGSYCFIELCGVTVPMK